MLAAGRTVLVCGNGRSAADSEHIAGELAKPCALPRPLPDELTAALHAAGDDGYLAGRLRGGMPVLSLAGQPALLTAIANDQAADLIFAQQVLAYGRPGDLLWLVEPAGEPLTVTVGGEVLDREVRAVLPPFEVQTLLVPDDPGQPVRRVTVAELPAGS